MRISFLKTQTLQKYVRKWWYNPTLFFCAAIDHYILVFPILGMMIVSVLFAPRRWIPIFLWSALGSWAGAWLLSWIAQSFGLPFIEIYFPRILASPGWASAESFFALHGLWLVFLAGLAPIPQQPAVIVASLAGAPLLKIGVYLLLARLLKFGLLAYVASHAPERLRRYRDVRKELDEMDVTPSIRS